MNEIAWAEDFVSSSGRPSAAVGIDIRSCPTVTFTRNDCRVSISAQHVNTFSADRNHDRWFKFTGGSTCFEALRVVIQGLVVCRDAHTAIGASIAMAPIIGLQMGPDGSLSGGLMDCVNGGVYDEPAIDVSTVAFD